ncbi:rod shape-determining protein RodA [Angustibacter sp. McL0619]|uniref:rod shape-determining protein RodA n=1 Tax=Angustibacter sp. McL0619 TaxID=3415676 RepID=UPI003CFB4C8C
MSALRWTDTRARRAREHGSVWVRLDWGLLVAALGLSLIGALLVWSATRRVEGDALLVRHLVNVALGMVLGGAVALVDYRGLRAYSPILYVASIVGLVAVLSPLGSTINGSHSWIVLPAGFSVQPSEFAKVAMVVALPLLLAEKRDADDTPRHVDVALALVVAAIPMALVMLQPDLGSMLVLAALVVGVVAASGAPARWVVGLLVVGAVGIAVGLGTNVLDTYQKDRLTAFANPTVDPRGIGYQTRQVRIAIGSGGLHGEGLFHGAQTQGGYVPYQQTDFVFSVAGEELGFLGAAAILLLEGFVLFRGLMIAYRAEELFGRLVAVGVVCWFTFQIFENVGMNLGIMPVTGLPLPFVSYGGSSMFASWLAIGLLQNVRLGMSARST